MTGTLTKIYLTQIFSRMLYGKRKHKTAMSVLLCFAGVYLVLAAGMMFNEICTPLTKAGLGWFYILIVSVISLLVGVVGSVFSTYSMVYQSKDNELLFSMPIPPQKVVFARLAGVYLVGTLYMSLVMLPALAVYVYTVGFTVKSVILALLAVAFLSVMVLALTCVLGFAVAFVSSKLRTKKIVTVVVSLLLLAGFYVIYFRMIGKIETILMDASTVAGKTKTTLYPFYLLGKGTNGHLPSLLAFGGISVGLFAVVYLCMSRLLLGFATANKGEKKKKYTLTAQSSSGITATLLSKEFSRFKGSVAYILNGGLGLLLMLFVSIFAIVKMGELSPMFLLLAGSGDTLSVIGATMTMMLASTVCIAAPSVSLEGKSILVTRTLPVEPSRIMMAKLGLQLIPQVPATLFLAATLQYFLAPDLLTGIAAVLICVVFAVFHAVIGLFFGVRMPNFDWTNETVVVKQSAPVMISMLGGLALVAGFCGIYFAVDDYVSANVYMLLIALVFSVLTVLALRWIKGRGASRFMTEGEQ